MQTLKEFLAANAPQRHDVVIGSPQWLEHRTRLWNASDAPAMMGVSPYKKRSELIRQMATGVTDDPTQFEEGLHASGHRFEELARPRAEEVLGEDLYQGVLSRGRLGASLDGQVFTGTIIWEHKRLNKTIREAIPAGKGIATGVDFPMLYAVQMEQQIMVSGAQRVLFSATLWEGERLVEERHAWYEPNPELAQRILSGWAQAYQDALQYKTVESVEPTRADPVKVKLPALIVRVKGEVLESNVSVYRDAAMQYIGGINTKLESDQDFAVAEQDAKFCEESEAKLALLEEQVMSQAADVNEVITALREIGAAMARKRIDIRKLADKRKSEKREEISTEAQKKLDAHIDALNRGLKEPWLEARRGAWGEAMKGKKSVATSQEAVDVALADMKVRASEEAARLAENTKTVEKEAGDNWLLFVDFARHGLKPAEDFRALAVMRWGQHQDNEKREREREAAKAEPAPAPPPVQAPAPAPARRGGGAVKKPAPLTLASIVELLGFTVDGAFLETLGFEPLPRKAAKDPLAWNADQFPAMCVRIGDHCRRVASTYTAGQ